MSSVEAKVSEYYGKDVRKTADLRTTACCVAGETTRDIQSLLNNVHDDVLTSFFGCGSPLPPMLQGLTVLDLGCGTGRDSYVAAQLVGESGRVIGVDMTEEQLEVAERTEDWHASKFGYSKPNTMFVHGQIDNLKRAGIADGSVDVVISNCVLNLVKDKLVVLKEIFRVLKPGGELFFSDVYSKGFIPDAAKEDKVVWGECLSGALDKDDFKRLMQEVGFGLYWTATSRIVTVEDREIKALLGDEVVFYSETIRAVKPAAGSSYVGASDDYGETARYDGSIPGQPHAFSLGIESEVFVTGVAVSIDHNTATALRSSRYGKAFNITDGSGARRGPWRSPRQWLAEGGTEMPFVASIGAQDGSSSSSSSSSAGGCCPPAGGSGAKGKCC